MKAHTSRAVGVWLAVVAVLALAGCNGAPLSSSPAGQPGASPPRQEAAQTSELAMPASPPQALTSLAPLADSVRSAVVNVEVRSRGPERQLGTPEPEDPFGGFPWPFMEPPRRGPQPLQHGLGSGFIIDPSGIVLTNNHVVEGAVEIQVRLMDGRQFDAAVVGTDPLTDVAVIQLKGKEVKDLPVVRLGDSDAMRVGDWVMAIGNPFGLSSSVSLGILSAKERNIHSGPYDDFLQTDAAINPGNSGGPLFNLNGEVIGINTAIVGGGTGIGFAVPSNLAKVLLPQLEKEGSVTRGWLGLGVQDLTPALAEALGGLPVQEGAIVVSADEGTPAAHAGLQADDVIVELDGRPIHSAGALTRSVGTMRPGTQVALTFYRNGQKQDRKVTLGTRPDLEGLSKRENRRSQEEPHQRIGLGLSDVGPRFEARGLPPGALITHVVPGSLAERSGLAPGMVVVEAGGKPVRSAEDLVQFLRDTKPGSLVLLRVQLGDKRVLLTLRIPE